MDVHGLLFALTEPSFESGQNMPNLAILRVLRLMSITPVCRHIQCTIVSGLPGRAALVRPFLWRHASEGIRPKVAFLYPAAILDR